MKQPSPASATSPTSGRSLLQGLQGLQGRLQGLRGWRVALVGAVLSSGCAMLPARTPPPPPAAVASSPKAIASQVEVVAGRGARLSRNQREQLLKRVAGQGSASLLQRHLSVMAAREDVQLYTGNEVKLLIDGPATFAAMFEAIESARQTILLESYIIEDKSIATRLAEMLLRKRAEGVASYVIYDSVGSMGTSKEFFERLKAGGVGVCAFNPVNPLHRPGYWGINHRDHRKILVVDGAQAFTGGINISEVYSSGSSVGSMRGSSKPKDAAGRESGWRDTQIRVTGPGVRALDEVFRSTWVKQGCEPALPALPEMKAVAKPVGDKVLRVIASGPDEPDSGLYSTMLTAIDTAERSVHLTMAYFAPGEDMIAALREAAQRGVDVQLILPSMSDFFLILEAGRARYGELLEAGVRIHELQDALLHAKTAIIDGVVSTVGSSNMDWRSFVANNEVDVIVIGEDFAQQMDAMFRRDLAVSTPITLEAWKKRPLLRRTKEWLGRVLEPLL